MTTDMARAVKFLFHFWLLAILAMPPMGQKNSELEGDIRQVHDPTIIKEADTYYVFSTRAGIAIRCSKDLPATPAAAG